MRRPINSDARRPVWAASVSKVWSRRPVQVERSGARKSASSFRFDQEGDEPSVETLAWDSKHALDYGGMLGMSKRCVSEQRTDGGKSSVAGARTIFPLLLKMVEEGADERRIKIVDV
jgi:hypothetical protein